MKKRIFTLFFAGVLLAMTLSSCHKENNGTNAAATKSIELKIAGLTPTVTKAIDDETKTAYAAALSSATVIFYSGDTVYDTFTTGTETDNITVADLEAGYVFHGIDNAATDVMVVGNRAVTGGTVSAIKAQTVSIAAEQGDGVTLVGEASLGGGQMTQHPEDGDQIITLVEAEVSIVPLVSRFEIRSIGCSDLGTDYTEGLVLNTIGLINFAENVTLGGTVSGNIITLGTYNPYSGNIFPDPKPTDPKFEDYTWYQFGVDAGWSFDSLEAELTSVANSVAAGEDKVWAYNFIPGSTTNIMLQLNENLFVRTSGFGVTFEPGKIYQLDYTFKEENIGPFDRNAIVCAKVTVTVKEWQIVAVTPVFE